MLNTPFWYFHDDTDFVPIDPARAVTSFLRQQNAPLLYTEAHGHGHSWPSLYSSLDLYGWLLSQRRNPYPATVSYRTETPYRGKCAWTEIVEFSDPNRSAYLSARVEKNAGVQQIFLTLENVEIARLELTPRAVHPAAPALTAHQPGTADCRGAVAAGGLSGAAT